MSEISGLKKTNQVGNRAIDVARLNRLLAKGMLYFVAVGSVVILLSPIVWMLSTAIKTPSDVFAYPPMLIPEKPTFDNLAAQFSNGKVLRFMFNSAWVGVLTAIVSCGSAAGVAYALSRYKLIANQYILLFFMSAMAFPLPMMMISMYSIFVDLSLLNTYWSLVLGHTIVTMPVAVWILKNFFDQIPIEIEEAAFVDGASRFQIFIHVVLPMTRPGLAASAIYVFITSWNEMLFGLTFISDSEMRPLPSGISAMFLSDFQGDWQNLMAMATVVSIPVMLIFFLFQKKFLKGVTAGALKG